MELCGRGFTVNTIEKAFFILERVVAHQDDGQSFSEIVKANNLPKSSTHRILRLLVGMGYLVFDQNTKKFRASLKIAKLGALVTENIDLRTVTHPYLQRLHEVTGHTCHLGIINGTIGVYLDKIEPKSYGIRLFSAIGKDFPLHCTAMGKILLAFSEPTLESQILSGKLDSFTEYTITDPAILDDELEKIRKNGYAIDREEITRGIMCVAAPVINHKKEVMASISATFPSYLANERGMNQEIEAVINCAKQITQETGGKLIESLVQGK
jgi:DNA-binding IclR family transcriptional regulator